MDEPTTYRIELRGEAGERVLHPFLDHFEIAIRDGRTTMVGDVTDVAHLHGLLVHLTSLNAEVINVTTVADHRSPT